MGILARREANGQSQWSAEWKHGVVPDRAAPVERGERMPTDLLTSFFARYPSASGGTHAGGQYTLICPECGHSVPVAVLDEQHAQLHVHCANCGYDDVLGAVPEGVLGR